MTRLGTNQDELVSKANEVFHFINRYINANGVAPTVKEIGRGFGHTTSSLTDYYLRTLKLWGWITWQNNLTRTIVIIRPTEVAVSEVVRERVGAKGDRLAAALEERESVSRLRKRKRMVKRG